MPKEMLSLCDYVVTFLLSTLSADMLNSMVSGDLSGASASNKVGLLESSKSIMSGARVNFCLAPRHTHTHTHASRSLAHIYTDTTCCVNILRIPSFCVKRMSLTIL